MRALVRLLGLEGRDGERDFRDAFWTTWPEEHRRVVAEGFWELADERARERAIVALARHLRFRPASIHRASLTQRVDWLLLLTRVQAQPEWALRVASEYVFSGCQPLCEDFMDGLGIPHDAGTPTSTDYELPHIDRVVATIANVRRRHRDWRLELLLAVIVSVEPRWRPLLQAALATELADVAPPAATVPSATPVQERAEPASAEEPGVTEDAEAFTTLDNLLIKTVVASLNNVEGALTLDALEDLVDEVLELSADRHRSFFHRGFLDVLRGREPRVSFPGGNESRRHWYLAGVLMGLTRLNRLEDVVALYERQGDAVRGLLSRPGEGGAMVAPHIFRALREAGRWGEALAAIEGSLRALGPRFAYDLLSDASDMLRRGRIAEAGQILDFLHRRQGAIIETLRAVAEEVAQHFEERLGRKMAQCLQSEGELARARDFLDRMLAGPRPRELASILADRGLIEGGFKALSDVRLPATEEEEEQVAGALAQGEGFFQRAIEEDPECATNAAYCLGILAILRRDERGAIARLTAALTGMSRQAEFYRVANVLGRTEFLLGLALLESADPAQARYAGELVLRALRAGSDVPLRWWARAVVAASMYGDALASQIGEELCAVFGDAVIDSIGDIPQVLHATAVRQALSRRAADEMEPIARRWGHYERLLRHALATGDRETAGAALDALEGLAQQSPERERFLELLDDPQRYEPAWTREDALWAWVRGLEALGRYEEAAGLLAGVFHARLVDAEPEDIEEARGIVGRIRAYGLPGYDLSPLERRLEGVLQGGAGERQAERDAEVLGTGPPILVVLVGGNETQARYDEALQREIQAQYPRVRVEFIHTNWSSNWGRQLDDMRGRLVAADAVVVMRMIRTELGRRIRAMSPVWVPCIGHGRESIRQAIVRAATVAAVRRQT